MSHVFDPKDPVLQPVRSRRRTVALVGLRAGVIASFCVLILSDFVGDSIPLAGDGIRLLAFAGIFLTRSGLGAKLVRPAPMTSEARAVARGIQIFLAVLVIALGAILAVLSVAHRDGPWDLPAVIALFVAYLAMVGLGYRANLWRWRDEHRER